MDMKKNRSGTRYFEDEDGEITAKECTKCGEVKIMKDFAKHKSKFGGRVSDCKSCRRKYREENREYLAEYDRKYYEENREHYRKYREENREYIAERHRKYREENREYLAAQYRKHYEENREHYRKYREENREYYRKYYEENREHIAAQKRKHYEENREYRVAQKRKYHKENPHVMAAAGHRRRARKSALPDTLTNEQLEEITDRFRGGCALTGCTDGTHLDHVIPVVTGHGGTTMQNMVPLRADLNLSKSTRCIFDWFYDVKEHFKLPQTKFDELIEYLADINGMTAGEYEDYARGCHDNSRAELAG